GEGWDEGIKIKYFSLFLILLTPTLSSRRGSFLLNLTALGGGGHVSNKNLMCDTVPTVPDVSINIRSGL
ncbi:hypothetical protein, partial [Methylomicrobium sp. Wu6]|uniref:hypothetical protein n=1 Tax=Methylomicrobium sp. Wu6 TaxID=3107928 RepID=UPI002DD61BE8